MALWGGSARAAAVNGSASIWSYVRNDTTSHVQVAPMVTLNVRDFGVKSLRFESSLRGFTDIRHSTSEDRRLRIWRAVFVYAPDKSPWEARLGQQWLTEGVGRGNVAGLWVKHKLGALSSVTVFGGARVLSSVDLQETNHYQGLAAGIHGQTRIHRYNVGASYFFVGKDKVLYQGAGVEASGRIIHNMMARGRFDVNLEHGSVEKGQLGLYWTANKRLDLTGEFRVEQPRIFEDSYFRQFLGQVNTTFGRVGALWNFYKMFYVRGNSALLFTESDNGLYKVQAAAGFNSCRSLEVGYTHWLSVDKAKWDGLFGEFRCRCFSKVNVDVGFDWARGSNAETTLLPARDSQSLYFGAEVTPISALTLSARAEQIKDPLYKSQWRGLFSIGTHFSNLR
ncbi:MAG TPA: hypothetical protein VGL38_08970 [bacterium]|jgi:hypothetical protein